MTSFVQSLRLQPVLPSDERSHSAAALRTSCEHQMNPPKDFLTCCGVHAAKTSVFVGGSLLWHMGPRVVCEGRWSWASLQSTPAYIIGATPKQANPDTRGLQPRRLLTRAGLFELDCAMCDKTCGCTTQRMCRRPGTSRRGMYIELPGTISRLASNLKGYDTKRAFARERHLPWLSRHDHAPRPPSA